MKVILFVSVIKLSYSLHFSVLPALIVMNNQGRRYLRKFGGLPKCWDRLHRSLWIWCLVCFAYRQQLLVLVPLLWVLLLKLLEYPLICWEFCNMKYRSQQSFPNLKVCLLRSQLQAYFESSRGSYSLRNNQWLLFVGLSWWQSFSKILGMKARLGWPDWGVWYLGGQLGGLRFWRQM